MTACRGTRVHVTSKGKRLEADIIYTPTQKKNNTHIFDNKHSQLRIHMSAPECEKMDNGKKNSTSFHSLRWLPSIPAKRRAEDYDQHRDKKNSSLKNQNLRY